MPYQGYAESTVNLGLPELPDLHNVSLLLDGTTDQYVWYRSPAYWRADNVSGRREESDTYADGGVTYLWNYGTNLLTQVTGAEPVRLPRAPDLLPPELARRLLNTAGRADRISRLPDRRIAGVDAAGLRLVPAGPDTTIGAVEIWADPASGLPVEVQISRHGTAQPVLISTFLELSRAQPNLAAVIPHPAPNVGLTTTRLPDVDGVLNGDGDGDGDHTRSRPSWAGSAMWRSRAARRGSRSTAAGSRGSWCSRCPGSRHDRAQLRGPGRGGQRDAARDRRDRRGAGRPCCSGRRCCPF